MLKIRHLVILSGMLLCTAASAAPMSIGIGLPNLSIGINLREYPDLVVVPGYPVYYAPQEDENLFFYDGMYWVYQDDEWYASTWYNGPWSLVDRDSVPLFVLRVPVRYYRHPPAFFLGWRADAPPRWGDRWGHDWAQRREGWDRWNRRAAPAPAPLPVYQRRYSGDRYPRQVEQQHEFQQQHYRYQPRDPVVRNPIQAQPVQTPPNRQENRGAPMERGFMQQDIQHAPPPPPDLSISRPLPQPQQRGDEGLQRPAPAFPRQGSPEGQAHRPAPAQPALDRRDQPPPGAQEREERRQGRDAAREPTPGQEQERGRGRGRDRND